MYESREVEAFMMTRPLHKRTNVQRLERKLRCEEIQFEDELVEVVEPLVWSSDHMPKINITIELVEDSMDHSEWEVQASFAEESTLRSAMNFCRFHTTTNCKSLLGKYFPMGAHTDQIMDVVEQQLILVYSLWNARSATDRYVALISHAKMRNDGVSELAVAAVALQSVLDHFVTLEEMEVQSFEFPVMPDMRAFLDRYDSIKASPVFEKLYKFAMYALSLSLFKPVGVTMDLLQFDKLAQAAVHKKYHLGIDFVYTMLDTILFLCERGYQCYQSNSIMPMFHSEAKYQTWFDEADKLVRQANLLNNPGEHGIDRFGYLSDLKDTIEKGQCMRRIASKKDEKMMISKLLSSLELTHDMEVTKRAAQKDRPSPFCLLLYGGSSIGKSTLTNILFQHYGKICALRTEAEFRYIRNPTEEFWSGFNSTQWCVVLDDIGFISPRLGVMDPSLAEMLCVANNVPFVPAQAELHDKGRTPVRAELVIGSTNTEDLNLHAYFSCPLAVQRRFPYVIDVKPKAEFMDMDKPGFLDSSRVPRFEDGESGYPDFWTFIVKKVVPAGDERHRQMGKLTDGVVYPDMPSFLTWYSKAIRDHRDVQQKVLQCGDSVSRTIVCQTCDMPLNWCKCAEVQSDEFEDAEIVERDLVPSYISHYVEVDVPIQSHTSFLEYVDSWDVITRLVVWFYLVLFKSVTYFKWVEMLLEWLLGTHWFLKMVWRSRHSYRITRVVLGYAGRSAYASFTPPSHFVKYAGAITACLLAYKGMSSVWSHLFGMKAQGGVPSKSKYSHVGGVPEPDLIQRKTPIYQNPYAICTDDISQASLSNNTPNLEAHVSSATVLFTSRGEGIVRVTTAVNIRGAVYMCNNHGIPPSGEFSLNIACETRGTIGATLNGILVTEDMVLRLPQHDLAFVYLRCRPPATDLTKYFCKEGYTGLLNGSYFGRDVNGKGWSSKVYNLREETVAWKSHERTVTRSVWRGKIDEPTMVGDCGMLLLSRTPAGPIILGIHTLGNKCEVGSMKVTLETVVKCCNQLEPQFIMRGQPIISAPSCARVLGDLSVQSNIHASKPGTANVLGSFAGEFRQRGRTCVGPTHIRDAVVAKGYVVERTAPDMGRKPWIWALNDMTRPVVLMRNDVLKNCVTSFVNDVKSLSIRGIQVYNLQVAVNGAAGVKYCDKVNRKTSAGCPYKRSKRHFLLPVEGEIGEDLVEPTQEIVDTIDEIISTYHRGERYHVVFCGHLKDEPVSFEKALTGKTRVFTASPMAWTIVVRMYLLSVIVYMQTNRFEFETGPGTVVQSLEWEEIREHLVQFGEDRIVAGDYSKFDKRMPANVILAAFDIILALCLRAGYTAEDISVVRGIAYDTAFPNVDFHGDLIEFYGSNPSGHPLTVIVNGLANSLYMRYCYTVLNPLKDCTSFKQNVALMTYGDDNIMGVAETAPWFNHTDIQRTLMEVDIGYTMADKEAVSVPYIHIDDSNFLKRTWRWDVDVGAYVAPLDHSSIDKMLTTCNKARNIFPEQHSIAIITTAVREYFWYGREIFEQKKLMFLDIVAETGLSLYVEDSTFPTWESLKETFWNESQHVVLKRELPVEESPMI